MNSSLFLIVLLSAVALFAITNGNHDPESKLFFGGNNNCQPFLRRFVRQGAICFQPNTTMLSCRNETCVCGSRSPNGNGNGTQPGNSSTTTTRSPLPFPLPTIPTLPPFTLPPIPRWHCRPSNSTSPPSNSTSTTTTSPGNTTTTTLTPPTNRTA